MIMGLGQVEASLSVRRMCRVATAMPNTATPTLVSCAIMNLTDSTPSRVRRPIKSTYFHGHRQNYRRNSADADDSLATLIYGDALPLLPERRISFSSCSETRDSSEASKIVESRGYRIHSGKTTAKDEAICRLCGYHSSFFIFYLLIEQPIHPQRTFKANVFDIFRILGMPRGRGALIG
jgi:hypothetical protein